MKYFKRKRKEVIIVYHAHTAGKYANNMGAKYFVTAIAIMGT
jgi:hypothetical protein